MVGGLETVSGTSLNVPECRHSRLYAFPTKHRCLQHPETNGNTLPQTHLMSQVNRYAAGQARAVG